MVEDVAIVVDSKRISVNSKLKNIIDPMNKMYNKRKLRVGKR